MERRLKETIDFIRKRVPGKQDILIVLGSGLGEAAGRMHALSSIHYTAIPHFKKTGVATHKGRLVFATMGTYRLMVMQGRWHLYEGYTAGEAAYPVLVAHALGAKMLIATNLSGGIHAGFNVGDFMAVTDHLNLSGENPLVRMRDAQGRVIFQDMLKAYSPELIVFLKKAAVSAKIRLHQGVLAFLKGPSFETPAELRFLKMIGADAVGWSLVPEVIMARAMGMKALGICCISDKADPRHVKPMDLDAIFDAGVKKADALYRLLAAFLKKLP